MIAYDRGVDAALLAAMASPAFYPITLVFVDWPSDPVYAHSGIGDLAFDGQIWSGIGEISRIVIPEEFSGLARSEATIELAMTRDGALAAATNTAARNRTVRIWMGATTTPGGATLIGAPVETFTGFVVGSPSPDSFVYQPGSDIAVFRLKVSAGQPARASASTVHSFEDTAVDYPSDTGFLRCVGADQWQNRPPQWPQP